MIIKLEDKRPVVGEDLDTLREMQGLSVGDACWIYGMSLTKWSEVVRNGKSIQREDGSMSFVGPKDPITKPALSLLVRSLSNWSELEIVPSMPTAHEIYERVNAALIPGYESGNAGVEKQFFSIMFGSEISAGYRWLTKGSNVSKPVERLFYVFKVVYDQCAEQSDDLVRAFVEDWISMIKEEGLSRGVEDIFKTGRWNAGKDSIPEGARPILGQDLDSLREELGLSTMDANFLFGLSITKWMMIAKRHHSDNPDDVTAKDPLSNPALAMLVRVLRKYPEASPIFSPYSAQEVYQAANHLHYDAALMTEDEQSPENKTKGLSYRRFSILFGCEASSGYRWLTLQSKISPILNRLFEVYMRMYNIVKDSPEASQAFRHAWESMVLAEGQSRGVPDVLHYGFWDPNNRDIKGSNGSVQYRKEARVQTGKVSVAISVSEKEAMQLENNEKTAARAKTLKDKLISRQVNAHRREEAKRLKEETKEMKKAKAVRLNLIDNNKTDAEKPSEVVLDKISELKKRIEEAKQWKTF